ncbi:hypothetical protein QEZ54_09285 [Catellatospora sp. KI3]|uniref:hypothetical protein n=1 Tax=Catellatospora sp. KI3 TaxID=3041620 RepID=UPI002482A505|nr:hypothetical protein [Catellatospora sp. KI3]MDI1461157.1 hypothetical protein [Catellatospora sp. KI3]
MAILIGDVDVAPWLANPLTITKKSGLHSEAKFLLKHEVVRHGAFDYSARVVIKVRLAGVEHPRFHGYVNHAWPDRSGLHVHCISHAQISLNEARPGWWMHENVRPFELIYTMSRTAGYSDDQLRIEGIDELKEEDVEVLVPIYGIRVERETKVGPYTLVPPSQITWTKGPWTPPDVPPARIGNTQTVVQGFNELKAYLKGTYRAKTLFEAERRGSEDADIASAWLATRLKFTSVALPHEVPQWFNQMSSRVRPQSGSLLAVRALESGRRWIRATTLNMRYMVTEIPISESWAEEPQLMDEITVQEREAFLCFWRSVDLRDPLTSLIALFDTIEFYVGSTTLPDTFAKEDLNRLMREAPEWLSDTQRTRYTEVLRNGLNSPSLARRLDARLKSDGVPVTEAERATIRKLRGLRNPAQHGRKRKAPAMEDLRTGWSVVARMLVYRAARVRGDANDDESAQPVSIDT